MSLMMQGSSVTVKGETNELVALQNSFTTRAESIIDYLHDFSADNTDANVVYLAAQAFTLLYKNEDLATANQYLIDLNNNFPCDQGPAGEPSAYWSYALLVRTYNMFNANSSHYPGRLSASAEAAIKDQLWDYIYKRSKVADADLEKMWRTTTENHDMMKRSAFLLGTEILLSDSSYSGLDLYDGESMTMHHDQWEAFMKAYFKARAEKGANIEVAVTGYGRHYLKGIYNIRDFATDSDLKVQAEKYLDLFYAVTAQETIEGRRGGSKTRAYKISARFDSDVTTVLSYLYYNTPDEDDFYLGVLHPDYLAQATSSYRVPVGIMDLALYHEAKGDYSFYSTMPAKGQSLLVDGLLEYDFEFPSYALRFSHQTSGFISGAFTIDRTKEYTKLNSQNRWMGVVFNGDNVNSRVYLTSTGLSNNCAYNDFNGVGDGKAMILQKIPEATHDQDTFVYFSGDMEKQEDSGWIFAYDPSPSGTGYIAVKPASGSYTWQDKEKAVIGSDTYVSNGDNSDVNYDEAMTLSVKNSTTDGALTYLNFTPAYWIHDTADQIKLRLYVEDKSSTDPVINLYGMTSTNDEFDVTSMTWNVGSPNHDATGYTVSGTDKVLLDTKTVTSTDTYIEFDVTDYINNQVKAPIHDNRIGFLLGGQNDDGSYVTFTSGNGSTNKPELVINCGTKAKLSDEHSPVVFQMGLSGDYNSFADFITDVKNNTFNWNSATEFEYQPTDGLNLKYYTDFTLPKVDDVTVNLNPAKSFDSPFISGYIDDPVITITPTMEDEITLDFSYPGQPEPEPEVLSMTFNPDEDAYIHNGTPDVNYGWPGGFNVRNHETSGYMAYLKFDTNSYNVSDIAEAKLRVYVDTMSVGAVVTHEFYGIDDDSWDESTMTWNTGSPNHDATGYSVTGVGTSAFLQDEKTINAIGQYYEVDVTDYVKNQYLAQDKIISFLVAGKDLTSKNVVYASSEATANKPELIITRQDTIVTNPVEDGYIYNGGPDINYGWPAGTNVRNHTTAGYISYMKFDASSYSDVDVTGAKIRVYVSSKSTGAVTHELYGISDDSWDASTMTWNNGSPNHESSGYTITGIGTTAIYMDEQTIDATGIYYEYDVSDFIKSQLDNNDTTISIMITGKTFTSKNVIYETSEGTNKPELIINY